VPASRPFFPVAGPLALDRGAGVRPAYPARGAPGLDGPAGRGADGRAPGASAGPSRDY